MGDLVMKGIDVSSYQGTINFKQVKASGVEFVIIKAGYHLRPASSWETHYTNAKNNGLKVGAYWYSIATTLDAARAEIKAFIAALKGKELDFPVYLDVEEGDQFKQGKKFVSALVDLWCSELRKAGYFSGVYCSTWWYTNYVDKAIRDKYPAWIADYRDKCYYKGVYGIWQYDAAPVPGVQYICDRDEGYVDYSPEIINNGWNNYDSGDTAPAERKKTVDELAREVINGLWGVGQDRKDRLTAAGYSYKDVQGRVNEILYPPQKTNAELAQEVIEGEWGAGDTRYRLLTEAGYDYYKVQRIVNERIYGKK